MLLPLRAASSEPVTMVPAYDIAVTAPSAPASAAPRPAALFVRLCRFDVIQVLAPGFSLVTCAGTREAEA